MNFSTKKINFLSIMLALMLVLAAIKSNGVGNIVYEA